MTVDLWELLDGELEAMRDQAQGGISIGERCGMEGLDEEQTKDLGTLIVVVAEMFPMLVRIRYAMTGNMARGTRLAFGEVATLFFFAGMKYERHRDD